MRPSTGQGVPAEPASRFLLVDTSAYFALVDRTDQHHLAASAFVRASSLVLVNAITVTCRRSPGLPL